MYRKIFIPTEHNNVVPFTIPREWYGKKVEFIAYTIENAPKEGKNKGKADITKYFGAWKTDKSAEEIIADIYDSRTSGKTRILEDF